MVERRRSLAKSIIEQRKTNNEELSGAASACGEIVAIQSIVESLDAAIADEKRPQGPAKVTFGNYGHQ